MGLPSTSQHASLQDNLSCYYIYNTPCKFKMNISIQTSSSKSKHFRTHAIPRIDCCTEATKIRNDQCYNWWEGCDWNVWCFRRKQTNQSFEYQNCPQLEQESKIKFPFYLLSNFKVKIMIE